MHSATVLVHFLLFVSREIRSLCCTAVALTIASSVVFSLNEEEWQRYGRHRPYGTGALDVHIRRFLEGGVCRKGLLLTESYILDFCCETWD